MEHTKSRRACCAPASRILYIPMFALLLALIPLNAHAIGIELASANTETQRLLWSIPFALLGYALCRFRLPPRSRGAWFSWILLLVAGVVFGVTRWTVVIGPYFSLQPNWALLAFSIGWLVRGSRNRLLTNGRPSRIRDPMNA